MCSDVPEAAIVARYCKYSVLLCPDFSSFPRLANDLKLYEHVALTREVISAPIVKLVWHTAAQ